MVYRKYLSALPFQATDRGGHHRNEAIEQAAGRNFSDFLAMASCRSGSFFQLGRRTTKETRVIPADFPALYASICQLILQAGGVFIGTKF
jgi:hypothetical protein